MGSKPWLAKILDNWSERVIAESPNHDKLVNAFLEQHPERRIVPIDIPGFDVKHSTPDELRQAGVTLCKEADRLEALDGKVGPIYVLREVGKICATEFLFCDKIEKDVRLWCLTRRKEFKDKKVLMYREWWVDDPSDGRKRVVKREIVCDPIKDADTGVYE